MVNKKIGKLDRNRRKRVMNMERKRVGDSVVGKMQRVKGRRTEHD